MKNPIDINKSISNKRLIYYSQGYELVKYILENFISFLLIGVSAFMAFVAFMQSAITFCCVSICLVIWLIFNKLILYKLSKIACLKTDRERSEVIRTVAGNSTDYEVYDYNDGVIILEKPSGIFSWGRLIIIIIDHNDIYLNIQTLMRGGTPSPYHGIINYIKSQRIKKKLLVICE